MAEVPRETYIQPELEVYQGFFDAKWASEFTCVLKDTKLADTGNDFVRLWEAASSARALPYVMTRSLQVVRGVGFDERERETDLAMRFIKDRLVKYVNTSEEEITPPLQKKIEQTIDHLRTEYSQYAEYMKEKLRGTHDHWERLVSIEEFRKSVWSSERMCYGAIYYAYEWFLLQCIRIHSGELERSVIGAKSFGKELRKIFSQELMHECWTDRPIEIARLTRNALVHNGGRVNATLEKLPHGFNVDNDDLRIEATDTTDLYKLLSYRALKIAKAAVSIPEFR